MNKKEIITNLPYQYPFLFVDEILSVGENAISGTYTYDKNLPFYKGHFKDNPITPGVILTETMAQIGLVALGIFLLKDHKKDNLQMAMTSSEVDFFKAVLPGEKVVVKSEKQYFRFNKLKCTVQMFNQQEELVCRGNIAGMIKTNQ